MTPWAVSRRSWIEPALRRTTVRDLDAVAHLSFGDYSVREYFWQINSFRALRAHDIAQQIGVAAALPDELVQGVWDEVSPHAEEWRTIGVWDRRPWCPTRRRSTAAA